MSAARRTPAALLLLLAITTGSTADAEFFAWDVSTIDDAAYSGNSLSLRVEPAGVGHIAYWTSTTGVRYGTRTGDAWTLETLPDAGSPPAAPEPAASPSAPDETNLITHTSVRLALAPDGSPWIAEIDHGRLAHSEVGPIAVRHREAGAWATEWIGNSPQPAALDVDASGGVHAAWSLWDGTIVHALRVGPNVWETETGFASGWGLSMRLGLDGSVHLALVGFDGMVRHVVRAPAGGWTATPVATPELDGFRAVDLALDPAGLPAIVTNDYDAAYPRTRIRLHRFSGLAWTHEDVDVDETPKQGPALAFRGTGQPVLAYLRFAENRLVVALREGTEWTHTAIDPVANGDLGIAVNFDGLGRPWIASTTQAVGVRLAVGQPAVDVPAAGSSETGAWLGSPVPRPARAGASIRFAVTNAGAGSMVLETVDVRGAVLRREAREVPAGGGSVELPTRGLAPGVYWVRVRDTAGTTTTRPIVLVD